jgi:hypothetical protein
MPMSVPLQPVETAGDFVIPRTGHWVNITHKALAGTQRRVLTS